MKTMTERDTRTLPEIYGSLTDDDLKRSIREDMEKKLGVTLVAVHAYLNGSYAPRSINDRRVVAKIINSNLGLNTTAQTLFPPK